MNKINNQNIILGVLFVLVIALSFFIVKPLITTILTAFIIGYIFYPLFRKIKNKIKNRTVAAMVVSIFIVLLITIPTFFIVNQLSNEVYVLYTKSKQTIVTGDVMGIGFCEGKSNIICSGYEKITGILGENKIKYYTQQSLERITTSTIERTTSFAFTIPIRILQALIVLFILYYFFKDHSRIVQKVKSIIPLKSKYSKDIIDQVDSVTYAIVFGYITIAIIEGIVGAIGFRLFFPGSAYIFWGIVIAFLALIPFIGATAVWVPAIIFQIIDKHFFLAFGLVICMIITAYIDTITRPKMIGKRANVHPVIVLLGVIGGIAFIGLPGVVLGPVALALLNTFIKIFTGQKIKTA